MGIYVKTDKETIVDKMMRVIYRLEERKIVRDLFRETFEKMAEFWENDDEHAVIDVDLLVPRTYSNSKVLTKGDPDYELVRSSVENGQYMINVGEDVILVYAAEKDMESILVSKRAEQDLI